MASPPPDRSLEIRKRNFSNIQVDAVGVGLVSAAAPFLPVFLARLGASNFQVGLLTSMPGMAGLILAFFVGRFLQTRRKIVPWFSLSRLMVLSSYALTGLVTLVCQFPDFVSISAKRFVYLSAVALGAPILPLYFVRVVGASDGAVGTINMTFTFFLMGGYMLWPWVSRRRGGRFVLLATTLGMVLYPALTATSPPRRTDPPLYRHYRVAPGRLPAVPDAEKETTC
jgi:Na+/melibiose symporter-like transporter